MAKYDVIGLKALRTTFLLSLVGQTGLAAAQTAVDPAPSGATAKAISSPACRVAEIRSTSSSAPALLQARCDGFAIVIGEAQEYTSAFHEASGTLLVVRQRFARTDVSAVVVGQDGAPHVEELAPYLLEALGKAGIARTPQLSVDLAAFAATGIVSVSPVFGTATKMSEAATRAPLKVDLKGTFARAKAVRMSAPRARSPRPATGTDGPT